MNRPEPGPSGQPPNSCLHEPETLIDATNPGHPSAPRPSLSKHAGAVGSKGRTPIWLAAVIAWHLAATAVGLTGDSGSTPALTAFEQSPNQPPCIAGDDPFPSAPLAGAVISTFDSRPIRLTGGMYSGEDRLTQREAILDFHVPPNTGAGQDAVVLLTYTVHTTIPEGWSPSQSIALLRSNRSATRR
jgi:hypothetical protein